MPPTPSSARKRASESSGSSAARSSPVTRSNAANNSAPAAVDPARAKSKSSKTSPPPPPSSSSHESHADRAVGVCSDGTRFPMPQLRDPFSFKWPWQWSPLQWLQYSANINVALLLTTLPTWVFVAVFFFWRCAYNFGIGYLLHQQSRSNRLTKIYVKFKNSKSRVFSMLKRLIVADMLPPFNFDEMPDAFNAWLFFRVLVDVVLANDLVCYFVMCARLFDWPNEIDALLVAKYVVGVFLCFFALWGKSDAYRVIGSFAWYWGDFFFLVDQQLTFDRVFGIAPHPMYTLGYSFFYGASLICGSYAVFACSLVAHLCQMIFLVLVENPHIEKTYNTSLVGESEAHVVARERGYIRKDLIVLKNFNPYRDSDLCMMLMVLSHIIVAVVSSSLPIEFFVAVACCMRAIHSIVLPIVLWLQSTQNFWLDGAARHGLSTTEAFDSWKRVYNTSMVMSHLSFLVVFFKVFEFSSILTNLTNVTMGLVLLFLNLWCANEIYEVVGDFGWFYGDFFVHDNDVAPQLAYTGIYRYVNNPETVLGFAGYYGMALMSLSPVLLAITVFSHIMHVLFVRLVEEPHMKLRYGSMRRPHAGVESTVKTIVREAVASRPHVERVVRQVSQRLEQLQHDVQSVREKIDPEKRMRVS